MEDAYARSVTEVRSHAVSVFRIKITISLFFFLWDLQWRTSLFLSWDQFYLY